MFLHCSSGISSTVALIARKTLACCMGYFVVVLQRGANRNLEWSAH